MKKIIPRAHFQIMRGTVEQADKYCEKEGDFAHKWTISKQGKKKMNMEDAVQE